MNLNIPRFECFVRDEYLYAFESGHGRFTKGICHSMVTIEGRALGFNVLLNNGAHIGRLPIHALVTSKNAPRIFPGDVWRLQLWDCFSYQSECIEYSHLSGMRCKVFLPDKSCEGGEYWFTIDYYGNASSEEAGDSGWKCHHIIELDNGLLVAQPNNRVCFFEPASVVPFEKTPRYKTMERTWKTEDGTKWRTEDSNAMFYGVQQIKSK